MARRFNIAMLPNNEAELFIYDAIGVDNGFEAGALVRALNNNVAGIRVLHVRIFSFGGSAREGIAIFNALRRFPGKVVTHVDASADSIASIIALAGDERFIAENAAIMVHHPFMPSGGGTTDQIAAQLEALRVLDQQMISIYSQRTGLPEADVTQLLTEQATLTPDMAVRFGFATAIEKATAIAAATNRLQVYARQGAGQSSIDRSVPMSHPYDPNVFSTPQEPVTQHIVGVPYDPSLPQAGPVATQARAVAPAPASPDPPVLATYPGPSYTVAAQAPSTSLAQLLVQIRTDCPLASSDWILAQAMKPNITRETWCEQYCRALESQVQPTPEPVAQDINPPVFHAPQPAAAPPVRGGQAVQAQAQPVSAPIPQGNSAAERWQNALGQIKATGVPHRQAIRMLMTRDVQLYQDYLAENNSIRRSRQGNGRPDMIAVG